MPLLLVTVARGSKVPGAACSPYPGIKSSCKRYKVKGVQ